MTSSGNPTPVPGVAPGGVWAILPDRFPAITALLARGETAARPQAPKARQAASVAVIPIHGVLTHRPSLMSMMLGGSTTVEIASAVRQAAASARATSIVLDIDSPGGSVEGIQELAEVIARAARQKPVIAVANSTAASAAYWLASQATEIVVTPSGMVGSIGVIAMHTDRSRAEDAAGRTHTIVQSSRFKSEGNPYRPLDTEAHAEVQRMVDSYHEDFVQAVAAGRGVPASTVRSRFGQGRMMRARDALQAGMVDRVASLDDVLRGQLDGSGMTSQRHRGYLDARRAAVVEQAKADLARLCAADD